LTPICIKSFVGWGDINVGLVAVGVQEQAEDILVLPLLQNCLTLMTFPFPVIISPPKQCNSFYCLGHFKNVYDDDDDDEQPRPLTVLDRLEKLVDAVAPGELGRVSDGAGADEPEEHAERVDVDAAVVLRRQQFRRHVQRRAHHAAGHHRRRLAETEVRQLAAVVKVQLSTTTDNRSATVTDATFFWKIYSISIAAFPKQ